MLDESRLRCCECGRRDPGDERGWTLRLDVDGELVAFCPTATSAISVRERCAASYRSDISRPEPRVRLNR
jgi:hypothetical protein